MPDVLRAEPLRLLVPKYIGPNPLSQYVRTTIYFDIVKAFQHVNVVQKGSWIIYGLDEMAAPTHDAAIDAASWPSVQADLVIWGKVYAYADGAAVQLYLTITPILASKHDRPELWRISSSRQDGKPYSFELDLPSRQYEFEPILLSSHVIVQHDKPEGVPLYRHKRKGDQPKCFLGKLDRFVKIEENAIYVESETCEGWVRTEKIGTEAGEVTDFVKGFVRLLRSDWDGARQSFSRVLSHDNIPQDIRIHSLIYSGLAREKKGLSGMKEFEAAYRLNNLDKGAVSYLLMSRISEITRLKQGGNQDKIEEQVSALREEMQAVKVLFGTSDKWFQTIVDFLQ